MADKGPEQFFRRSDDRLAKTGLPALPKSIRLNSAKAEPPANHNASALLQFRRAIAARQLCYFAVPNWNSMSTQDSSYFSCELPIKA
jgi:hypothetical protein